MGEADSANASDLAQAALVNEAALKQQLIEERQQREALEQLLRAAQIPSNPLQELRKLKYWPKDNQSWQDLQESIWFGHPKLAPGWIRVWSRSKDSEYYVRVSDGKATFN